MVKYFKKGGEFQELSMFINLGILISEEVMEVYGIILKDVVNKFIFQQVVEEIYNFIGNVDLVGYNFNCFDIFMLMEEFDCVGIEFSINNCWIIDVQCIFYKMEFCNFKVVVCFYCNKEMENVYDVFVDVYVIIDVFKGQLEKYRGVDYEDDDGNIIFILVINDMQVVYDFINDLCYVDVMQKMKYDVDGFIVFSFGKYNGKLVGEILFKDK